MKENAAFNIFTYRDKRNSTNKNTFSLQQYSFESQIFSNISLLNGSNLLRSFVLSIHFRHVINKYVDRICATFVLYCR